MLATPQPTIPAPKITHPVMRLSSPAASSNPIVTAAAMATPNPTAKPSSSRRCW